MGDHFIGSPSFFLHGFLVDIFHDHLFKFYTKLLTKMMNNCSRGILRPSVGFLNHVAGLKHFKPPPNLSDVVLPEKPKLFFLEKVPQLTGSSKAPKMAKRLTLMRGPEPVHNQFIHKQYGIVALCGGRLRYGHMEMMRLTINRKMDASKMFATWRIDAPWQPLTKQVDNLAGFIYNLRLMQQFAGVVLGTR